MADGLTASQTPMLHSCDIPPEFACIIKTVLELFCKYIPKGFTDK